MTSLECSPGIILLGICVKSVKKNYANMAYFAPPPPPTKKKGSAAVKRKAILF